MGGLAQCNTSMLVRIICRSTEIVHHYLPTRASNDVQFTVNYQRLEVMLLWSKNIVVPNIHAGSNNISQGFSVKVFT